MLRKFKADKIMEKKKKLTFRMTKEQAAVLRSVMIWFDLTASISDSY